MKRLLLLLALLPAVFAGCTPETLLTVSTTPLEFDNHGGSISVNFVANKAWSISSNVTWCKVSPSTGDGSKKNASNATVIVTCDPNTDYDARTCTVTVICEEKTATITVKQAQANALGVTPDQAIKDLSTDSQNITFTVKSNIDYAVSFENPQPDWLEIVSTKGLATTKITVKVAANNLLTSRSATMVVKDKNGEMEQSFLISQVARKDIILSNDHFDLPWEDQHLNDFTVAVEIEASVQYSVFAEEGSVKYVRSINSHSLSESKTLWKITVKGNDDFVARDIKILAQTNDKAITKTLTIKQLAPTVEISFSVSEGHESQVGSDERLAIGFTPEELAQFGYDITLAEQTINPQPIRLERIESGNPWAEYKVYSLCEGKTAITVTSKKLENLTSTLKWNVVDYQSEDPKTRQALVNAGVDANYNGIFEDEEIAAVKKLTITGNMKNINDLNIFYNLEDLTLINMPFFQAGYWDFNLAPCKKLKRLAIHGTVLLEAINVTENKELVELDFSDNPLNNVLKDVTTNGLQKLEKVVFSHTPFEAWGTYDNPALKRIEADGCGLKEFAADGDNLEYVSAMSNQLTQVKFSGPRLKEAHFDGNKITELWLSGMPALETMTINNNALEQIVNTEEVPNLKVLECENNKLTHLEVEKNTKLDVLRCLGNPMTDIWLILGHTYSVLEIPSTTMKHYYIFP